MESRAKSGEKNEDGTEENRTAKRKKSDAELAARKKEVESADAVAPSDSQLVEGKRQNKIRNHEGE